MEIYSLFSGSKGNATLLVAGSTKILIDCGVTFSALDKRLKEINTDVADIDALILTHSHNDHVKGVKIFLEKTTAKVYASYKTFETLVATDKISNIRKCAIFDSFEIKDITVNSFNVSHDIHCKGFTFNCSGRKFSYITDLGVFTDDIFEKVSGSDGVFIESNYDQTMLMLGRYAPWLKNRIASFSGHLSNCDCASSCVRLVKSGTKTIVLGHLSEENNLAELAYSVTETALKSQGLNVNEKYRLFVATRNGVADRIEII